MNSPDRRGGRASATLDAGSSFPGRDELIAHLRLGPGDDPVAETSVTGRGRSAQIVPRGGTGQIFHRVGRNGSFVLPQGGALQIDYADPWAAGPSCRVVLAVSSPGGAQCDSRH